MPDITKGKTFVSGETVTAQELNSIVDDATINNLVIDNAKLAANAVDNSKVSVTAGIDYTKLATLPGGNLVVGNEDNQATSVALSGDISISNTGVTSLAVSGVAAGSYTNSDITVGADGRVTSAASVSGRVLQVVVASVTANTFSTTSTSMVDVTGLTASITPAATSSTILVQVMMSVGGGGANVVLAGLKRGTTQIGSSANATGDQRNGISGCRIGGDEFLENLSIIYEDTPVTTSSTVYQVTMSSGNSSYNARLNRVDTLTDIPLVSHAISTITLTEIAG